MCGIGNFQHSKLVFQKVGIPRVDPTMHWAQPESCFNGLNTKNIVDCQPTGSKSLLLVGRSVPP